MEEQSQMSCDGGRREPEHLSELEDGCGCAEIWEHLSEKRND